MKRKFFRTFIFLYCAFFFSASLAQVQPTPTDLKEILRHVYEYNPSLRAARAELRATDELYPQALAGWRPNLSLDSSLYAMRIKGPAVSADGDGTKTKDVGLSLNQPLFRGGRTLAETARANNLIRAGYAGMLQAEQDIFFQTIVAVADIAHDRTLLSLRTNNENLMRRELSAAQARRKAGELTLTDVRQAETRLARGLSEKTSAQADLESSAARFQETVGYPPPEKLSQPGLVFTFPLAAQDRIAIATQNNPEIQRSRYAQFAAGNDIDDIFGELMPQISAFASYDKQYDPQPGLFDREETGTIGVRASIPLYEAGFTRSRIRQAKDTAQQRVIEVEEVQRRIERRLMSDWNGFRAAQAEITSRHAQIAAAKAAREGVREEARAGERTVLDILDADQELIDAEAALADAERNEILSHYALAEDLGILMPQKMGIADVAYDPRSHYRAVARKIFSLNPE